MTAGRAAIFGHVLTSVKCCRSQILRILEIIFRDPEKISIDGRKFLLIGECVLVFC